MTRRGYCKTPHVTVGSEGRGPFQVREHCAVRYFGESHCWAFAWESFASCALCYQYCQSYFSFSFIAVSSKLFIAQPVIFNFYASKSSFYPTSGEGEGRQGIEWVAYGLECFGGKTKLGNIIPKSDLFGMGKASVIWWTMTEIQILWGLADWWHHTPKNLSRQVPGVHISRSKHWMAGEAPWASVHCLEHHPGLWKASPVATWHLQKSWVTQQDSLQKQPQRARFRVGGSYCLPHTSPGKIEWTVKNNTESNEGCTFRHWDLHLVRATQSPPIDLTLPNEILHITRKGMKSQ